MNSDDEVCFGSGMDGGNFWELKVTFGGGGILFADTPANICFRGFGGPSGNLEGFLGAFILLGSNGP